VLPESEAEDDAMGQRATAARATRAAGPVLCICSSGGHLLQLLALRPAWERFDRLWVVFDKSDTRSLLDGERVVHAYGPTNRSLRNLLRNAVLAVRTLRAQRPAAILTTGAGVAVPFAWIGRLYGVPTVYVESFTRIEELSLSARLISPVASRLYVQWPELAARAPRLHFAGNLFAQR
jgi:beta-1,4-N-acetylglucosaminyltransferase